MADLREQVLAEKENVATTFLHNAYNGSTTSGLGLASPRNLGEVYDRD